VDAGRVLVLGLLEWAWHPAKTNLQGAGSSRICMPSPNILAFIVSEISAFKRKDRLDRLG